MTIRTPVSAPQNLWSDAQEVDDINLDLEQNYNNTITSGILNNHVGTGVLPEVLVPYVLFDSDLVNGILDGVAVSAQAQPTDLALGNQLQVSLSGSLAVGKRTVKVAIIGLDFQNNLQYETFVFANNEVQVGKKHFTQVLVLLFNDLRGDANLSLNLGGSLVISQAAPLTLSRDTVMVAQDQQPNLFFRDFFVHTGVGSLTLLLQSALPLYDINSLNIFTAPLDNLKLVSGDVITQIGEKFIATTDNIQKITLLLSVENLVAGQQNDLAFDGDLIASIYPLQASVVCNTDFLPNLPIDFSPNNIPLAQITVNYNSLLAQGIVLDSNPQPIDFVFSSSAVANGGALTVGSYYAITLKRSGTPTKCNILIATGQALIANSRISTFTGSLWVDLPDQQLWFKIWTDAAKITDGSAYDAGIGINIPKTITDPTSQVVVDNQVGHLQFAGGETFRAVMSAVRQDSQPEPDPRTGNPVNTVQQFVPQIRLLNSLDLAGLEKTSEPLIVGAIVDKNIDSISQTNASFNSLLFSASMAKNELLVRIVDDPTDSIRFNSAVSALSTSLLNGAFINAKFYPNASNSSAFYRIAGARLCSMMVGDVDGNGIIDTNDLNLLNTYLGYNLNQGLPKDSIINQIDGYHTSFTNGYTCYSQPFTSQSGISFQIVRLADNSIVATGSDGILTANPATPNQANFGSLSVNFNSITALNSCAAILLVPSNLNNYGGFNIIGLDTTNNVITLQKIFLTGDTLGSMFRADIDEDFAITLNDGYLLQNYIERTPGIISPTPPFPAPTSNAYLKIGTKFNVIRFTLETFVDRTDDFTFDTTTRSDTLHHLPDLFLSDGYFYGHDFLNHPSSLNFQQQLSWQSSLVITNLTNDTKLVTTIFSSLTGQPISNSCLLNGITCEVYPLPIEYDRGKIDVFVPDNLILGDGEILRPNGNLYKVDFEIGTIVLTVPNNLFGTESTLNVMDNFVATTLDGGGNPTGLTRSGFAAMKFSNCEYVSANALANNQVRFSVSIQSLSPQINGIVDDDSLTDASGIIVNDKTGVYFDPTTSLLTIDFSNLYIDPVLRSLSTKITITVFCKKAGFVNAPSLEVDQNKLANLFGLITVFSGSNNAPQNVIAPNIEYDPNNPAEWSGTAPNNVNDAINRLLAYLYQHNGNTPI